jgi:hypothetical protein
MQQGGKLSGEIDGVPTLQRGQESEFLLRTTFYTGDRTIATPACGQKAKYTTKHKPHTDYSPPTISTTCKLHISFVRERRGPFAPRISCETDTESPVVRGLLRYGMHACTGNWQYVYLLNCCQAFTGEASHRIEVYRERRKKRPASRKQSHRIDGVSAFCCVAIMFPPKLLVVLWTIKGSREHFCFVDFRCAASERVRTVIET